MKIFYIDPQSYSNLAVYDYNLLSNFNEEVELTFYGNILYSYQPVTFAVFKKIFKYSTKKKSFLKGISYIISLVRLFFDILFAKPDIIHIQWIRLWSADYLFISFIKFFTKSKVIYTAHNVLPHNTGLSQKGKYQKYYSLVDGIIVHTVSSKDELIKEFNQKDSKISVIHHGLLDFKLDNIKIDNLKDYFKTRYNLEDKIVFSILGGQSEYKGSDILVDVWAKNSFLHDDSKYHLFILGVNDGIDFSSISHLANVTIDSRFISNEEFLAVLRLTDVVLLPYRKISQSGVLLYAINENRPILVSNLGGLTEPLRNANIGWNMGESTYDNLLNTIIQICNEKEQIYKIKLDELSWEKLKSTYSWNEISNQTFKLYLKMLNSCSNIK